MEKKRKLKQETSKREHDGQYSKSIDLQIPRRGRQNRHASSNFHQRNFEIVGFYNFFPEEEVREPDLFPLEEEVSPGTFVGERADTQQSDAVRFFDEIEAQMGIIQDQHTESQRNLVDSKHKVKRELFRAFFPLKDTHAGKNEVYNLVRKSLLKLDSHSQDSINMIPKAVAFAPE